MISIAMATWARLAALVLLIGLGLAPAGASGNQPPSVTVWAPSLAQMGANAALTACSYDGDGDAISTSWTVRAANSPQSAARCFSGAVLSWTPSCAGKYVFTAIATDARGARTSVEHAMTVNAAPSASIRGACAVSPNETVSLTATVSDSDGDTVSCRWLQTGGTGPEVTLTGANSNTVSFVPPVTGSYVFTFIARDGKGGLTSRTHRVAANSAPTAFAGIDQTVTAGKTATLGACGYDEDGDPITFAWSRDAADAGDGATVSIGNRCAAQAWFTPQCAGTYRFRVTVTDRAGASAFSKVTFTVLPRPNQPPVVTVPEVKPVLVKNPVSVKARGTDPDKDYLKYKWTLISGPSGCYINGAAKAQMSFTPQAQGTYTFKVAVTDGRGGEGHATVAIEAITRNRARVHARLGDSSALPMELTTWSLSNMPASQSVLSGTTATTASFEVTVTENQTTRIIDIDSHLGFVNNGQSAVPVTAVVMSLRYRAPGGHYVQTAPAAIGDPSQIHGGECSTAPAGDLKLVDDSGNPLPGNALPALAGDSSTCFRLRARFPTGGIDANSPVHIEVKVALAEDASKCDCRASEHCHGGRSTFKLHRVAHPAPAQRVNERVLLSDMLTSLPDATIASADTFQVSGSLADGTVLNGVISPTSSFQASIAASGRAGSKASFVVSGPVSFVAGRCGTTAAVTTAYLAGSGQAPADVKTIFGNPSTASIDLIARDCGTASGSDGSGTGGTDTGTGSTGAAIATGDFVTFTQGGWGSRAHGDNPGSLRDANFATVFPAGLAIGDGALRVIFTSAQAVEDFLPQGGTAGSLTTSAIDPLATSAGVLAGQATALSLSVAFSAAGKLPQADPAPLGQLVVASGAFAGQTVEQLLATANKTLGGQADALPAGTTISDLNNALSSINECFVGGSINTRFLRRP